MLPKMLLAEQPNNPSTVQGSSTPAKSLTPLEIEIVEFFVRVSRLLGQPRSLAEIYGLLFISPSPLSMDDLILRLRLSKGSASQGLKFLRNVGAVRVVYVPGDRRTRYEAVAELRNLVTRFLNDQVLPHLNEGVSHLDQIENLLDQLPADERKRVGGRVKMLQSWGRNSRRFLPLVARILGK